MFRKIIVCLFCLFVFPQVALCKTAQVEFSPASTETTTVTILISDQPDIHGRYDAGTLGTAYGQRTTGAGESTVDIVNIPPGTTQYFVGVWDGADGSRQWSEEVSAVIPANDPIIITDLPPRECGDLTVTIQVN